MMTKSLPTRTTPYKRQNWKPLFLAERFLRDEKDITLEKFAIDEE